MRLHSFNADPQEGSDLFRVQSFSYILENFSLAKAELLHSRAAGFAFSDRRVDIGSFNSSPNAISHRHRKLMGAHGVENFIRGAQPDWKCAVRKDWLARQECIDLSFKFAISLRMYIPSHPRWAAIPPQPRQASGAGIGRHFSHASDRYGRIDTAPDSEQSCMSYDLNVSSPEEVFESRVSFGQNLCCYLWRNEFMAADDPQTEFILLQPSLEVRNQDVEQVASRFEEDTEVRAPRHTSNRWEPRVR